MTLALYVQTLPSPVVMEPAVYVTTGTRTMALETTVMVHVYISAFLQVTVNNRYITPTINAYKSSR